MNIQIIDHNSFIGNFVRHYFYPDGEESMPENHARPDILLIADPETSAEEIESVITGKVAERVVLLSSEKIYSTPSGTDITEDSAIDSGSGYAKTEAAAANLCSKYGISLTILRLPELVIGTGMEGMAMRIVTQIHRGTYLHIKGDESRRSTIHASLIGRAVSMSVPGIFNIADTTSPTLRELSEALSFRIGQKRIFAVSASFAKKLAKLSPLSGIGGWSREMLEYKTTTRTLSTAKAMNTFGFAPEISATDYLRNHVYDENSL